MDAYLIFIARNKIRYLANPSDFCRDKHQMNLGSPSYCVNDDKKNIISKNINFINIVSKYQII